MVDQEMGLLPKKIQRPILESQYKGTQPISNLHNKINPLCIKEKCVIQNQHCQLPLR